MLVGWATIDKFQSKGVAIILGAPNSTTFPAMEVLLCSWEKPDQRVAVHFDNHL